MTSSERYRLFREYLLDELFGEAIERMCSRHLNLSLAEYREVLRGFRKLGALEVKEVNVDEMWNYPILLSDGRRVTMDFRTPTDEKELTVGEWLT